MSKNIKQFFEATYVAGFLPGLEAKVMWRLGQEQKKLARRNIFIFGLADLFSLGALALVFSYLLNLLASSGFYSYVSLLWTDVGALNLYWQELLLSLVESLPLLGTIAFLAVTLVLVFSLAKTITNFKYFYYKSKVA